MKNKNHISGALYHRQNPKLRDYAYFSLRNIKQSVMLFANNIKTANYNILDMGCGNKPYKELFKNYKEYIGSDIIAGPFVDVVCDNANLVFEDDYFDYLICNQVLEHTKYINLAISEIKRVVRKDGFIFISVPFLYPEHACPWDYWRFTRFGLEELFKDFEIISIKNDTSYFLTLGTFLNMLFTKGGIVRILFSPLFIIINIVSLLLDSIVMFSYMLGLKNIKFVKNIIENTYNQFTLNYIIVLKNSKK